MEIFAKKDVLVKETSVVNRELNFASIDKLCLFLKKY
jgi:hypothetical protein